MCPSVLLSIAARNTPIVKQMITFAKLRSCKMGPSSRQLVKIEDDMYVVVLALTAMLELQNLTK